MPSQPRYSAFLDLVGTREFAKEDSRLYWTALNKFQEDVFDSCHLLNSTSSSVCFFSDCAFVESSSLEELAAFLRAVRQLLLQDHYYFKAAIGQGEIRPTAADRHPLIKSQRNRGVLKGYWFNEFAAELYSRQEKLKGIGIYLDRSDVRALKKNTTRVTCYVREARHEPVVYHDLALTPDEMSKGNLQGVLNSFFHAKTRSRRYGRYYVSLLVLWIQSLELSDLRYDTRSDADLVNLILSGRFYQLFQDVIGIENVFFTLLNRVYAEQRDIDATLFEATKRYLSSHRRLLASLQFVPQELLSPDVRRQCLGSLSNSVLNRFELLEKAQQRIVELRHLNKKPREIARILDEEGFAPPKGNSWHANSVAAVLKGN